MTKEQIYDTYAAAALQALVAKSPMLDNKGELGEKKDNDEMQDIKKELCRTAHAYAAWMMQTRQEYIDYCNSIGLLAG